MKKAALFILFAIGLLTFWGAIFNGFVSDDETQIENTLLQSVSNIPLYFQGSTFYDRRTHQFHGQYYRPIVPTIQTLIVSTFGLQPAALHAFQVFVYIINAYLVYLFLRRFFHNILALLLAIFFLIHPINAENAVYIANTQEVLFLFFGMLSLLLIQHKKTIRYSIFSAFFFGLSLLSKETGILFLIPLLLINIFSKHEKTQERNIWKFFASLAVVLFIYVLLRILFPLKDSDQLNMQLIMSVGQLLKTLPSILFFYIQTFFFPKELSFTHFWIVNELTVSNFYFPLIIDLLCTSMLVLLGYLCKKRTRGVFLLYLFFMSWFSLGILFHTNIFFGLDMTTADRWFYFPFVGLLGLLGIALGFLPLKKSPYWVSTLTLSLLIIIALTGRTIIRIPDWKTSQTIFSHDIKVEDNFIIESAYGNWLARNGKKAAAKQYLKASQASFDKIMGDKK